MPGTPIYNLDYPSGSDLPAVGPDIGSAAISIANGPSARPQKSVSRIEPFVQDPGDLSGPYHDLHSRMIFTDQMPPATPDSGSGMMLFPFEYQHDEYGDDRGPGYIARYGVGGQPGYAAIETAAMYKFTAELTVTMGFKTTPDGVTVPAGEESTVGFYVYRLSSGLDGSVRTNWVPIFCFDIQYIIRDGQGTGDAKPLPRTSAATFYEASNSGDSYAIGFQCINDGDDILFDYGIWGSSPLYAPVTIIIDGNFALEFERVS